MLGKDALGTERFVLGTPSLVCRWRLANCTLPLENRHLRALASRTVGGKPLSAGLLAWVKQHIEWTLAEGATAHPDGVLMLVVDEDGQAAMTVGPYEPLPSTSLHDLIDRAASAQEEGRHTGVAPESLWLVQKDALLWGIERDCEPSGAATLIADLARTMGACVVRRGGLAVSAANWSVPFTSAFLVSDEYGVVPASDFSDSVAEKYASSYAKLLASPRLR